MTQKINIVRGGKDSTGKSFFSRLLASYYSFADIPLALFDADTENKELHRYYNNADTDCNFDLINEEHLPQLDKILDCSTDRLIDLPGNVEGKYKGESGVEEFKGIDRWLSVNNLDKLKILNLSNLRIINWFVSDGSQKSLNYFRFLCKVYGKSQSIVLVKNFGVRNDWADENDPNSPDSIFERVLIDEKVKSCCMIELKELRINYAEVLDKYSIKMDEFLMSSYWSKQRRTLMRKYLLIHYKRFQKILKISDLLITRQNITMQAKKKYGEDFDRDRKW